MGVEESMARSTSQTTHAVVPTVQTLKSLLKSSDVKARFTDLLGEKAPAFMANVLSVVTDPDPRKMALRRCDPNSIIHSSLVAAFTGLSLDPSLGQAALVPYKDRATFQPMKRGLLNLALSTGLLQRLHVSPVYDGDIKKISILTGEIEWNETEHERTKLVGYIGFLRLKTGYEAESFWTIEELMAHGKRYSPNYKYGLWTTDPTAMYEKTIIKKLLKDHCPLNPFIDAQAKLAKALQMDGGTPKSFDLDEAEYPEADTDSTPAETFADAQEVEEDEQ